MTVQSAVRPLTPDRVADLEAPFETSRVTRPCFCMNWRVTAKEWREAGSHERRAAIGSRAGKGPPPGLLAYRDGEAVGWVQVTPRADTPRFNAARTATPEQGADVTAVWARSCFYIRRDARREGLMAGLARAACVLAAEHGATAVDAAPIASASKAAWEDGYVGFETALARAGFTVVERRTDRRALMRWVPGPT